jgi:glycosyltransferase involved in cell wall biosynthesis
LQLLVFEKGSFVRTAPREKDTKVIMMSKEILLLDGQIFQTGAWDRGMGKYMLQVMKQLSEQAEKIELKILFNSQIETNPARFETIRYLGPNFEQLFTDLPQAKDKRATVKQYKKTLNQYVENSFGASRVTYMITTLFSFDVFAEYPDNAGRKAMIFYDLIPLMNWKDLGGYFPPHLYMSRFGRMYESDVVYCISETTRQDVLRTFCLEEKRVLNINGGFTEHHLEPVKPTSFTVPKKYILFPTGNLPHKNNEIVFRAMKKVVGRRKDVHLLVTSAFSEEAKKSLLALCDKNVTFTQNVTDEELQYLYKNAAMVLFASKYEGLGLPVLDAVFHNKPIVASRISVFSEMSDDAFFFFDVDNSDMAAEAVFSALDDNNLAAKAKHYPAILAKYDWKKVGKAVLAHANDSPREDIPRSLGARQKVAIVSLNPGIQATLGRLSERLYGHIKDSVSVSYFFDSCGLRHSAMERPTFLDHFDDSVQVYDLKRLTLNEYRKFDKVIYILDETSTDYMIMQYVASLPGSILYDAEMDTASPMFRAVVEGAAKTLVIHRDNERLAKIQSFITEPWQERKLAKIMKSRLPKRVKYEYLKKELDV